MSSAWQPSATIETLKSRSKIIQNIRQFFLARDYLEVETPILARSAIPDANIISLSTKLTAAGSSDSEKFYLQTSPGLHMKHLLAAGSGPIFQIGNVFRDEERGQLHNPEFTLLEWYRPGFNHHDLMQEMDEFLQDILQCTAAERLSYRDVFLKYLDVDPHKVNIKELLTIARQQNINYKGSMDDKDEWLNLLMSHCIEPQLGKQSPTFIYDYPSGQAALAKINKENSAVAERFEVYVEGIELANGFHELTDAEEQRLRFLAELEKCKQKKQTPPPLPTQLLAALKHGMPNCTGVALGIDRLIMLALQKKTIQEVLSFC